MGIEVALIANFLLCSSNFVCICIVPFVFCFVTYIE